MLTFETEKKEKQLLLKEKEVSELKQRNRIKQQGIWMLIGGLLACFIIGFLFYSKVKSDRLEKEASENLVRSELKVEELKTQQLQTQLESKRSDLTNMALEISRKNEFSDQLIERLGKLEKVKPTDIKEQLRGIVSFAVNHLQINEDLALLQKNVDTVNHEFYQKLDERFKGLSVNEKHLAGLIRLNLSNKEIATIRGISAGSAKVNRHRLRKKLQLESSEDIVRFLQEV